MGLNETLAGMQAKTDVATPRPWFTQTFVDTQTFVEPPGLTAITDGGIGVVGSTLAPADAEFIAMARTAMPALLSAVQNVLALCDAAERGPHGYMFEGTPFPAVMSVMDVRKALTDVLVSEPLNTGSKQ